MSVLKPVRLAVALMSHLLQLLEIQGAKTKATGCPCSLFVIILLCIRMECLQRVLQNMHGGSAVVQTNAGLQVPSPLNQRILKFTQK